MSFIKQTIFLFSLVLLSLLIIPTGTVWAEDEEADFDTKFEIEPLDPPRDYVIMEGDIMVTKEWYENRHLKSIWSGNYWHNMVIPYTIHSNVDATRDSIIHAALDTWERVCDIDFIPRTSQNDYIRIIADSNVNSSFVGPIGGRQDVKIVSWYRIIICHELFHAMGFWHEQSRSDRDTYVQIHWDNIEEGKEHNFEIHSGAGYWPNRYDFNSIMHYGSCAFDIETCGLDCCSTITMRPGYEEFQTVIGNRSELSHIDSLTAKFKFSDHPDWSFVATRFCADYGSFANPYTSWGNAFAMMPVGDTLWMLEGTHIEATGLFSKQTLIHNVLEQVTVGPDSTRGIEFGINAQIKMYTGGDLEIF